MHRVHVLLLAVGMVFLVPLMPTSAEARRELPPTPYRS